MSASGNPVPWAGTLTTTTVNGKKVLAEPFLTGVGWIKFPVYTFSGDESYGGSCWANSSCARAWPPVRTDGAPGWSGVPGNAIGEFGTFSGLQVSWYGHPLYIFSNEQLMPTANGGATPAGNGNGITAFGGTFSLVVNP